MEKTAAITITSQDHRRLACSLSCTSWIYLYALSGKRRILRNTLGLVWTCLPWTFDWIDRNWKRLVKLQTVFFCSQFEDFEDSHTVLWNSVPNLASLGSSNLYFHIGQKGTQHPWQTARLTRLTRLVKMVAVALLKSLSQAEVSAQSKSSVKLTVRRHPNYQTRTNKNKQELYVNYLCFKRHVNSVRLSSCTARTAQLTKPRVFSSCGDVTTWNWSAAGSLALLSPLSKYDPSYP